MQNLKLTSFQLRFYFICRLVAGVIAAQHLPVISLLQLVATSQLNSFQTTLTNRKVLLYHGKRKVRLIELW